MLIDGKVYLHVPYLYKVLSRVMALSLFWLLYK